MNRQALINKVKSIIDEISAPDSVIIDVGVDDNNPIDTIITSLLDESAREILLKAPVYKLSPASSATQAVASSTDPKTGTIDLPADFLRLVELKMLEWQRPVTELNLQGSYTAKIQSNKYLRGGLSKPVAVLSHREGKKVIEYYSVNNSHSINRFLYIKEDVAENVPVQLQDALCWICASRVCAAIGETSKVEMAEKNAISLMM